MSHEFTMDTARELAQDAWKRSASQTRSDIVNQFADVLYQVVKGTLDIPELRITIQGAKEFHEAVDKSSKLLTELDKQTTSATIERYSEFICLRHGVYVRQDLIESIVLLNEPIDQYKWQVVWNKGKQYAYLTDSDAIALISDMGIEPEGR